MSTKTRSDRLHPSHAPVQTMESLCEHLQWALELEHATIPPYLCALYSLDADRNPAAEEVVISVFVEEMLHLTLAANLLNAVGGRPDLDPARLMQGYPSTLPHADKSFEVSVGPFGDEALELFLRIERPAPRGAPAESDGYQTIGQFYDAIERGLRHLCEELGEDHVFTGDPARQITTQVAYRGGGTLVAVTGLASALQALGEIVEQGEGAAHHDVWDGDHDMFHPERDEVGHFYRFMELNLGRRYQRGDTPASGPTGTPVSIDRAGVRPMQRNPRLAAHLPGHPVRVAQEEFNRTYVTLLNLLEEAFNGAPEVLRRAVGSMFMLKAQALALMEMPLDEGTRAGPTFEYVEP